MKPYRVLHTADLQLGKQQYGSFLRTQDFAAVLPQIAKIAEVEKVDLIVLAGDIFDSYTPDSYSERAFRKFVEQVEEIEHHASPAPAILAIEGNHEFDKRNMGNREVARIDAVTDGILRPHMADEFHKVNDIEISVVAADWMPASKIQTFLDGLPNNLDVLVMHQSCEGFIPIIGTTEMKLAQLKGKAKLILLGDLHLQKTVTLDDGTVICYPGSTELCASNEPVQKSVNIVDFDMEKREVVDIRQVLLQTRQALKLNVFDDLGLNSADQEIRNNADHNPIVFLGFSAALRPLVLPKLEEWAALGLTLIQPEAKAEVKETDTYVYNKDSADREMEEILSEKLKSRPAEQAAGTALWKTPDAAQKIVDQLERTIRESHHDENIGDRLG